MKKLYSTSNLVKAVSLSAAMATFLSSVSPIVASNVALTGHTIQSSNTYVNYSFGSHGSVVFAGDESFCGADNVTGRGHPTERTNNIITAEEQFRRFVENQTFDNRTPYGTTTGQVLWHGDSITSPDGGYMGALTGGDTNAMPVAYGIYSFATGCGSYATGNYSTVFGANATATAGGAQAFGVAALAAGRASVAMGMSSEASGEAAIAFGGLASALGKNSIAVGTKTKAEQNYGIAIGSEAEALGSGAIAIGSRDSDRTEPANPNRKVTAKAENSIAIGTHTYAEKEDSVAIGANAQVTVNDGVAIGGGSLSDRAKGIVGYDPYLNSESTETGIAWKSTTGAFSVGEVGGRDNGRLTRQITGVAAGSEDTDAVNVAQLKAMRDLVTGAWSFSINGENATEIQSGSTLDFFAVKHDDFSDNRNIKIVKGPDKQITFDLNDYIKVNRIETGISSLSNAGLMITGGPNVTEGGIFAGNKKITGVEQGTNDNDAVNFAQLKAMQGLVTGAWSFSINGENATEIQSGSTLDFFAVKHDDFSDNRNIKIVKGPDKQITFDLNDYIKVNRIETGISSLSNAGLMITGGPNVTEGGIFAGNKKITGVEQGTNDNDAVNFAQLKAMQGLVTGAWSFSINGENATEIQSGSTLDFFAVKHDDFSDNRNIKIVKGPDKQITFDLNDYIKVNRIETGISSLSNAGLMITGGPNVTEGGIFAGNKKITGVEQGTNDNDAVNFAQLKAMQGLVTGAWSFSINGENATEIQSGSTLDFFAVKHDDFSDNRNIKIVKGPDKQITFDLNDYIKVNRIETGISSLSNAGLMITGGPNVTEGGIFAGNKKITGVEQGTNDNDAVNFAQLKAMQGLVTGAWSFSINGENATEIQSGSTLDFFAVKHDDFSDNRNIKIVKGPDKQITFDLNDYIKVNRIETGISSLSNAGLMITGGPNVTEGGIFAGNKKITGVKQGTNDNDAVNFAQLNDFRDQITNGLLIKQDGEDAPITIGQATNGIEINIANKLGDARKISGVKAAENDDEAVNKKQFDKELKDISKNIELANASAVLYDKNEDGTVNYGSVTLGGTKSEGPVFLHNVKDGIIAANSTDAITGNQLYLISNQLARYFGGGAGYREGVWTAPNFSISQVTANGTVNEQAYQNVAEALDGINGSIVNINNRIGEIKNQVNSDSLHWSNELGAYDASRDGQPSKIINVADGEISQDSKEAVNGGQLWETNERVKNVAKKVDHIENRVDNISNTIADIGDTIADIGDTVLNIENKVDNIENTVGELADGVVKYDRDEEGNKINKVTLAGGNESEPVLIDNVADGRIEQGSKEAINGGQLHDYTDQQMKIVLEDAKNYTDKRVNNIVVDAIDDAVERANKYTNMKFEALSYSIENVRKEAKQAAAIGLAVSNLRYNDIPGKLSIGFGSGLWRSQSAFAFGAGYTSENGAIRSNISVTTSGGHWGVGAGFNMTLN